MRLALSLALVTPCLLAACGDNLEPDEDSNSSVQSWAPDAGIDADAAGPDADAPAAREIRASLLVTSPECFDAIAAFEVEGFYVDDGSPVPNLECHVVFDDGGPPSDSCAGRQNVSGGGLHTFKVDISDPATGAIAHLQTQRMVDAPLRPNFEWDMHTCGLHIDFNLSAPMAQIRTVTVSPAEGVIGGPVFGDGGGIDFSAPGNYTLTAYVEQERATGPICSLTIPRPIFIQACDHEHGPSCSDW